MSGNAFCKRLAEWVLAWVAWLALMLPNAAHAQAADVDQQGGAVRSAQIHKISGFLPDLKFTLSGAGGRTVTHQDLAGKVVVMFFGYANCPDICPTTLGQLALVMRRLGDAARHVRLVFVSVDPHRDQPDALQAYVNLFDTNALGLTGSEKQIADLARRYRVAYQIEKPKGQDTQRYEVTHSRGIFVFDQAGRARLLASDASPGHELGQHLLALLTAATTDR